ncbi:MAG: peptidoglycan editing factor PgeF [Hungatella sp.]|nr:peptidoglycan editing factor PgeF [Hungatella sp.]
MEHEIRWVRKGGSAVVREEKREGVTYLTFPILEESGLVSHGFSTRMGGVSQGIYASMNFTFTRGDNPEHVRENYRRMAKALSVDRHRMVLSYQTHTTNVRRVTARDEGKGMEKERDYQDVDGLITDIPGITLVTFYADCVPLYILDPVHKAIGLSHSGWRGTVGRMGAVTLKAMKEAYGTRAEDVLCAIGPSICRDCFEVGEEVAAEFQKEFDRRYWQELISVNERGRYQLDLWKANEIILRGAGVRPGSIETTDICTRCNPQYLFSHRAAGDKRGNLAAFLCLKEG